MPNYLSIYHRLPNFLKVAAASARGYQLRWWRYGRETEELIDEALERENWTEDQWQNWQGERLEYLLDRATKQIPYYRSYWQQQQKIKNKASWNYLENWPILEKEVVRKQPLAFVTDDCNINKMYVDHTGGTTGTPLNVYESRSTIQLWYAIFEARLRRWHHVSINDNWGIFGGQLIVPASTRQPPYWVFNSALNQLYLSTFYISPDTARDYIDGLSKYSPTHLIVYPSSAAYLAHLIVDQNLAPPSSIRVIFSNAEILLPQQRAVIEKAFNCPVVNTYGMGELVAAAGECSHRNLHLWPEIGIIECLDEANRMSSETNNNNIGEYVVTGLINTDMALIRYRLGDRGNLPRYQECSCGRTLPVINELQGRVNDTIITKDGRKLFWFNSIFYDKPIMESQIVQESLELIKIFVIPGKGFSDNTKNEIVNAMRSRVGEQIDIVIITTTTIPRTKSGKLQAVISKVR